MTRRGLSNERPPARRYDSAFCAELEARMGEGYSLVAAAGLLGVSRPVLDRWMQAHPPLSEAVARGKARRLAYWEALAIAGARNGGGGSGAVTLIVFALKNMGDGEWSETARTELTGKDGAPLPAAAPVTI